MPIHSSTGDFSWIHGVVAVSWSQDAGRSSEKTEAARGQIARGWSLLDRGRGADAEQAFREAVRQDPELAEGHRGLAESLLLQGRPEEAGEAVGVAMEVLPDDPEILLVFAEILNRNPSTRPQGILLMGRILEADPGNNRLRLERARHLAWSGRLRESIDECRRVADSTKDGELRFQARKLEAQVHSWRSDQKQAGRLYRELIDERPGDVELHLGLADTLSWSGWPRRAERKYREVLGEKPLAAAEVGLADIDRREKRFNQAEKHFLRSLEIAVNNPAAVAGYHRNRKEAGPSVTVQAGTFRDNSDWDRDIWAVYTDFLKRTLVTLRTGVMRARYRQADDQQVYRTSVPLHLEWNPDPFFTLQSGISRNDYGDFPDSTSFFARGVFRPGADRVQVRAGFDRYDMIDFSDPFAEWPFNQAESIDLARLGIDVDEWRAGSFLRFTGRLTLDLDLAYGDISDGNERIIGYGRASYRLPAKDRVELFGSLYYQNVEDRTPLYFDPVNFQSYSLGALWEGGAGTRFRFGLEGSVAFTPREEDLLGGQIHAWAERDLGQHLILRGTANYLVSPQERGLPGEDYDAHYFSVSLVSRFPRPGVLPPGGRTPEP